MLINIKTITTTIAPIITVFFTALLFWVAWKQKEISKIAQRSGLIISPIDDNGVGFIENASQVEYEVELATMPVVCSCIKCTDMHADKGSIRFHFANLETNNYDSNDLIKFAKEPDNISVTKQIIFPGDQVSFHIHHLDTATLHLSYILLKFKRKALKDEEQVTYSLHRYCGSSNPFRPALHPTNKWVRIAGYSGDLFKN